MFDRKVFRRIDAVAAPSSCALTVLLVSKMQSSMVMPPVVVTATAALEVSVAFPRSKTSTNCKVTWPLMLPLVLMLYPWPLSRTRPDAEPTSEYPPLGTTMSAVRSTVLA